MRQTRWSEPYRGPLTTRSEPATDALRCTGRKCPTCPNSKVNEDKKPQVKGLTWGSPQSRLRDSNPRPTHYETMGVRDAWVRLMLGSAVSPDQDACRQFRNDTLCYLVQRRPAALWPHTATPSGVRAARLRLVETYRVTTTATAECARLLDLAILRERAPDVVGRPCAVSRSTTWLSI